MNQFHNRSGPGALSQERTRAFRLYEEGRRYNNSLSPSYYTLVDRNTEFFTGNQWEDSGGDSGKDSPLPKPVFNIIKRITSVLVAQITSGGLSVNLQSLSYYNGGSGTGLNITEFAQAEINNLIEKLKLEYRIRDALFDGARTGDYCAHFYWDAAARPYGGTLGSHRGEIRMEMVDGVNVMFGNPNSPDTEDQPYILLAGRDTVKNLRTEYLRYHPGDYEGAQAIRPDSDWNEQAASGGKLELTGEENAKCLYLYLYEFSKSRTGIVPDDAGAPASAFSDFHSGRGTDPGADDFDAEPTVLVSKFTRSCAIFEGTDTGLRHYPVAWGNWERQKNCYHGRALVTGILPNQIFINAMYAMVMRHLYLVSFPKIVYNADLIPRWTNEVGASIAVHGLQPGQSIDQVATVVRPADMSGQILGTISNVEELTRECMGVTDVQMGTEEADNTSAIMVVQQNAEVPLDNIRSGLYEWMETIVEILLDMMAAYYGTRPIVRSRTMDAVSTDPKTGLPLLDPATGMMKTTEVERRVVESFDFSQLREVWLNIRVDVGSSTAYSEIAMTQTLDNLRNAGLLTAEDYLERLPDKLVPMKQDLIDELRQQQVRQDGVAAGKAMPASGGAEAAVTGTNGQTGADMSSYLYGKALDNAKLAGTMPAGT